MTELVDMILSLILWAGYLLIRYATKDLWRER